MDILIHTLSGIAISTVIIPFFQKKQIRKISIIAAGAVGGAFPDIDAISLWSRFDNTFGQLFNLQNSGRDIYFSKLWYSHHGFFHSIVGILISAITIALLFHLVLFIKKKSLPDKLKIIITLLYVLVFFSGGVLHLIEDMLTPSGVWGGVRLFWPSKVYYGGLGLIWWWNNYDIFLVVSGVLVTNLLILYLKFAATKVSRFIPILLFCLGVLVSIELINSRIHQYNYSGFSKNFKELEQKSLEEQQRILKPTAYKFFFVFDKLIPFYF